jgi:hypothetical protein
LYFKNEDAWAQFFDAYYSPSYHKVGSTEPVSHLFKNLELTDAEREILFGKAVNCHTFMSFIESTQDFDSNIITEEDLDGTAEFDNSVFYHSPANKSWDDEDERFNFIIPLMTLENPEEELDGEYGG